MTGGARGFCNPYAQGYWGAAPAMPQPPMGVAPGAPPAADEIQALREQMNALQQQVQGLAQMLEDRAKG